MPTTIETGARAEREVVEYLRREGYLIMDTNWRNGRYELDIVARKGDTVHFVEVKARKCFGLTSPEEAMNKSKQRVLLVAANSYISSHAIALDCCIDLAAVDLMPDGSATIRYIPNAVHIGW